MAINRIAPFLSEADKKILGDIDECEISSEVRKHASKPSNFGFMKHPHGQAVVTGICEDTVIIQLRLSGNIIEDICFQTKGCGFTKACSSAATELVRGKSLKLALNMSGEKIIETLGGLPQGHVHCAYLAANTLKQAAQNALEYRREPSKRLFRLE